MRLSQLDGRVATASWHAPAALLESSHDLLLQLAGRLPDDLLCRARGWLAEGDVVDLLRGVSFAVVAGRVPVFEEEVEFLTQALRACDLDQTCLAEVEPLEFGPRNPFAFLPVPPAVALRLRAEGHHVPECLDHTTADGGRDGTLDRVDASAALAAAGQAGVLGLWRGWRIPAPTSPWPSPKRVYLVEVTSRGTRHAVAGAVAGALADVGETAPLVEVWAAGDDVPEYQLLARLGSALLWAASARNRIRLAPILAGPASSAAEMRVQDLPRLTDEVERQSVLEYLEAGAVLLTTDALGEDIVEPRGTAVPVDIRTDGTWVWTDASAYYLRRHLIAPHPDLLAHIRAAGFEPRQPNTVAVFRAIARLAEPDS